MRYLKFLIIFLTLLFSCKETTEDKKANEIVKVNDQQINKSSIQIPTNESNFGLIRNVVIGCGYNYAFKENDLKIFLPSPREINIINNILSYSGIPSNFEIYNAKIENAVATIIENQRYIIYDESLFDYTDKSTKSNWSSISILAHEIGHHLSGHTMISNSDKLKNELEADKFSGFVLYKMGASLEEATMAILLLGTIDDTETHPSKSKRIQAIKSGWDEANRQRYEAALPPPPNDDDYVFNSFDSSMLINKEYIDYANEFSPSFYKDMGILYGIITEINKDFNSFRIRILKMENIDDYPLDLTGVEWDVYMDEVDSRGKSDMCPPCASEFKSLMVPGRRLKFSMVEAYPGAGTSMNGVWFLTYAERIYGHQL